MNALEEYFRTNSGRLIHKWNHYFEIYDRHFSRFRGKDVHLVEFGVSQGGSLQMWKNYFGSGCKIYGVDINPHCKELEQEGIEIYIGDQGNVEFLKSLAEKIPRIDILIDDGGHRMLQQINTFEVLFPHIDAHGVYLCEDTHSSYWPDYGGGYRNKKSFIEYSKNWIDYIHAWHSGRLDVTDFTRSVHSLTYYDSVVVIEKRPIEAPTHQKTGTATIPSLEYQPPRNVVASLLDRLRSISRR